MTLFTLLIVPFLGFLWMFVWSRAALGSGGDDVINEPVNSTDLGVASRIQRLQRGVSWLEKGGKSRDQRKGSPKTDCYVEPVIKPSSTEIKIGVPK